MPEEHREEVGRLIERDGWLTSENYVAQKQKLVDNLLNIKRQLVNYMYIREMLVLGFNSAKYDIKVIAPYMIPMLLEDNEFNEFLHTLPANWHGNRHVLGDYSYL